MSTLAEVEVGFSELSDSEKERFLLGISSSEGSTGRIVIWAIVLVIMAGIIFFFGYLGYLRLAAEVTGGVIIYCTALAILDSRRIFLMRDIVLKRGAVSA